MKHAAFKWIGMLSWLITALTAINVGLGPFGFDFFATEFMLINMPQLIIPLQYIILISGVVSLALLVMTFTSQCGCGSSSCNCK